LKLAVLPIPISLVLVSASCFAAEVAADRVYRNGVVFTSDARSSMAEAVAIREGRIVYVGSNGGVAPFIGSSTKVTDLKGAFLMPGLIDGHLHPLEGGLTLEGCSLHYESLTIAEFEERVQACLDKTKNQEPDGWLEVVNWFQESMRPAGVKTSRATLDVLKTSRPIIVRSSQGHTVLANSRALALAKITKATPDPVGGKIRRDADGDPSGLLEDSAFAVYWDLIPKPTAEENISAAKAAQQALNRQGVTSFLDAWAVPEALAAFTAVHAAGELTVRAHFAPLIDVEKDRDPGGAVAKVVACEKRYDQGGLKARAGITVRNAKLFLDGVIYAPALTGAMLDPYRVNAGTPENPRWVPGPSRGPAVYFPPQQLAEILVRLGQAGIDPHMHADGDGAVRAGLDAVEAMRILGTGYRLLIAGKGDDKYVSNLRDKCADLPIAFPGFVSLPDFFETIDVLLVPSWEEPFGLVVLEGMASGIPVIATAAGGPQEIINSEVNGLLVPPRDSKALAAAIASIHDQRDSLIRAARVRAEEFDIRKIVPQIEKFYRAL